MTVEGRRFFQYGISPVKVASLMTSNSTLIYTSNYTIMRMMKGGIWVPAIKPVSALRNYATVLEEVSAGNPVYLTKNGYGSYAVIAMSDMDEFEQTKAALKFMQEMNKGIRSGEEEGWLSADQVRENMRARREAREKANAV